MSPRTLPKVILAMIGPGFVLRNLAFAREAGKLSDHVGCPQGSSTLA